MKDHPILVLVPVYQTFLPGSDLLCKTAAAQSRLSTQI